MTSRAGGFWTERKVAWYRRALSRSDFARTVLEVIRPLLDECESVLDVGAGCGALTIPLAERLRRVTALEPSSAMAKALAEEARARGLRNITIVEGAWGDVALPRHDLVLCAHVGELLRPDSPFLREVSAVCRRGVALVRDAGGSDDKFFFKELYPILLGRPYGGPCEHEETVEGLARLGVQPTVSLIDYRSDQPFDDLEEACDFWMEYMALRDEGVREFLRNFLAERLVADGPGLLAPYPKRAAVIWWRSSPQPGERVG
ncbi:MAG: class I SAM-dependent methyltransferase [Candidatus Rokubacteria bacterium]|nr:class I SAM-dependent methyltransferase [Candidatus Rokubacteria bacterium]